MNNNNYAVIMAGGIGSRFWPMSKSSFPKQFLDVLGTGETLIQQTFRRLNNICPPENIFIVTNKKYQKLCADQLSEIRTENILCEPAMRNTAPCIAYAAFRIFAQNPEANMIVAPSDHLITNEAEFVRITEECLEVSKSDDILITLGIQPSRPDTGYGYIQFKNDEINLGNLKKVKTFTEKPSHEIAVNFIESGDFLWNSGIFIWSAKSIITSLKKHLPDMYDLFNDGMHCYNTDKESSFIEDSFPSCKNISIDYGIMEKSNNVLVYPSDFGWSDLGTWGSLQTHIDLDNSQNGIIGKNVMTYNCEDNIINVPNDKLVVVQGAKGFIIVEKDNTLLICKKESEQMIKSFVSDVRVEKGEDFV